MTAVTNLVDVVKTVQKDNLEKAKGEDMAFSQVVKEAQLSSAELMGLWGEYSQLINDRTGYPYTYVSIYLPRRRVITTTAGKKKGKLVKKTQHVEDPDLFTIPNCEHQFSRNEFYSWYDFEDAVRQYYRKMGYSISFHTTETGLVMKVYMN
jgi:hypothetical protein